MSTTTTPTTSSGAAGDLFSALNRLVTEARAGGIRSKARVSLTMAAGFEQQAAALEQYARDLQETGQYPPFVWEPAVQAAGMLRAAAMKLNESANAITSLAKTPAGELVGKAPARDELNKA